MDAQRPPGGHRCGTRGRLLVTVAGGLAVAGVGVVGLSAAVHAATMHRIVPAHRLRRQPVALVLGAEVYPDGRPSGFLRARLDVAIELHRRGLVDSLLLSGDGTSPFYDEPAAMKQYVLEHGVPDVAILVDPDGIDTYTSCARARDVFGLRRLVVVSQRYHLPRALAICRLLGLDAWGVGDVSTRHSGRTWASGARREVAANLKLLWDVATQRPWSRPPVGGTDPGSVAGQRDGSASRQGRSGDGSASR